MKKEISSV
ncbi:nef attachable domain protein, partial [Chlamydia psittaci 03DC29]